MDRRTRLREFRSDAEAEIMSELDRSLTMALRGMPGQLGIDPDILAPIVDRMIKWGMIIAYEDEGGALFIRRKL